MYKLYNYIYFTTEVEHLSYKRTRFVMIAEQNSLRVTLNSILLG